jgi:hypothetical protein
VKPRDGPRHPPLARYPQAPRPPAPPHLSLLLSPSPSTLGVKLGPRPRVDSAPGLRRWSLPPSPVPDLCCKSTPRQTTSRWHCDFDLSVVDCHRVSPIPCMLNSRHCNQSLRDKVVEVQPSGPRSSAELMAAVCLLRRNLPEILLSLSKS